MSSISKRKVDRAIRIVESSLESHERCINEPETEMMGDPDFHRQCVREYEKVLKVLRQVRVECGE